MRRHPRQLSNTRTRAAILALAPLAMLAWTAQAQDADPSGGADGEDPVLVVSRTVHPRIAYKGLEPRQNPVHTQATTFPGRVFHGTLGTVMGELADTALTEHGSAGVVTDTSASGIAGAQVPGLLQGPAARAGMQSTHPGQATGQAPMGAMGSAVGGAGGAIRGATGAIGALLGDGLKNTSPVQQGGGG